MIRPTTVIKSDSNPYLGGAITLTSGTNVTLGQVGNTITINASDSAVGTVTTVSVTTANGVSGSVANPTTTPAITLTLGAITPTSVNSVVVSGSSTPTLAVTGTTSVSGANTGDQIISDATITTTDITTNDASTSKHGFMMKYPGGTATYLRADGTFSTVTTTVPDLNINKLTASTNQTITAGYGIVVPRKYIINSGIKLIIGLSGYFRIL